MANRSNFLKSGCKWLGLCTLFFALPAGAQELNGTLVIEQDHSGTQQTQNNIQIENFSNSYVKDTTLVTGNQVLADLEDQAADIVQTQTGTANAHSLINVGEGYILQDTAAAYGNSVTLTSDADLQEFTARIGQDNGGETSALIELQAGTIEFYRAFLSISGNDLTLKSNYLRSNTLLSQNNSGANRGELRQTGGLLSASNNIVVSGNNANFSNTSPEVLRPPAFIE